MSCPIPAKSTKKRKLENSECEKPASKKMAWDSFNSIQDFGYKFNEEGRLVDIEHGDGFNFHVSDEHSYNQKNYEMLGEVITEHVYELLKSDEVGLKMLEIPQTKESSILSFKQKSSKDAAKGFIFASENFEQEEKLLVLVHGSGVVRAGQWARRLIINDCLDHGTQIPYIKQAIKDDYGVVVLNTNQNDVFVEIKGKKAYKTIKESESPEKHFSYVWKNIIEKTKASKIFLVAHSYGGYLVVNYFKRFPKNFERVVAVAFTDSVHGSLNYELRADVREWFLKNSVNWVTSNEDLDTPMYHQDDKKHTTRVSAGTQKHEETSWKAMDSIFRYFQNKELDFKKHDNEKSIEKKGKTGASNKNQPKDKTEKDNKLLPKTEKDNKLLPATDNKVTKKLYSQAHIPVASGHEQKSNDDTSNEQQESSGGSSKQDGMNDPVEVGQEPSKNDDTSKEQLDKNNKKPTVANFIGSTVTEKNGMNKSSIKKETPSKVGGSHTVSQSEGMSSGQINENDSTGGISGVSEEKPKDKSSNKKETPSDLGSSHSESQSCKGRSSGQKKINENECTDGVSSVSKEKPKDSPDGAANKIDKDPSNNENDPGSSSSVEEPEITPVSEPNQINEDLSEEEKNPTSASKEQPEITPDSGARESNKGPSNKANDENDPGSSSSVEEPEITPVSEPNQINEDRSKKEKNPTSVSYGEQPEITPDSGAKESNKGPSNKENDLSSASQKQLKDSSDSEAKESNKGPNNKENDLSSASQEQLKDSSNSKANEMNKDARNEENYLSTEQDGEKTDKKGEDISGTDQKTNIDSSIQDNVNTKSHGNGDSCAAATNDAGSESETQPTGGSNDNEEEFGTLV